MEEIQERSIAENIVSQLSMRVIKESGSYIWIKFNNAVIKTTKNSAVHKTIVFLESYLKNKPIKAFRTVDILEFVDLNIKQLSYALHQITKSGALKKTKKRIVLPDSSNLEHVYGLTEKDILLYILQKLEETERREYALLFREIMEKGIVSTREAREICKNLEGFEYLFIQALGVIKKKKTDYISFYYAPWVPEEDVERRIQLELPRIIKEIKEEVRYGKKFEEWVEEFFLKNQEKFHFKLVRIERQKRMVIGNKVRIFDLVLYFQLYFEDKPIKGVPLLIVPIEIKKQPTGQYILVRHLLECLKAFSHNFIPLVITSEPRKSAFEVAGSLKIGLLTDSDFRKLKDGGERKMNPSGNEPIEAIRKQNNISITQSEPQFEPKEGSNKGSNSNNIIIIRRSKKVYYITINDYLILKEIYEATKSGRVITLMELRKKLVHQERCMSNSTLTYRKNKLKELGIIKEKPIDIGVIELQLTPYGMKLYEEQILPRVQTRVRTLRGVPRPPFEPADQPQPASDNIHYYIHKIIVKLEFTDPDLPFKLFGALKRAYETKRNILNLTYEKKGKSPVNHIFTFRIQNEEYKIQVVEKSDGSLSFIVFLPSFYVDSKIVKEVPERYKQRVRILEERLLNILELISGEPIRDKLVLKRSLKPILRENEIERYLTDWEKQIWKEIKEKWKEKFGEELNSFVVELPEKPIGIDNKTILERPNIVKIESDYLKKDEYTKEYHDKKFLDVDNPEFIREVYRKLIKAINGEVPEEDDLVQEAKGLAIYPYLLKKSADLVELSLNDIREITKFTLVTQYLLSENIRSHVALVKKIESGLSKFLEAVNIYFEKEKKMEEELRKLKREAKFLKILVIIQAILIVIAWVI